MNTILLKVAELKISNDYCGRFITKVSGVNSNYFTIIDKDLYLIQEPPVGVYSITISIEDPANRFTPKTQTYTLTVTQCTHLTTQPPPTTTNTTTTGTTTTITTTTGTTTTDGPTTTGGPTTTSTTTTATTTTQPPCNVFNCTGNILDEIVECQQGFIFDCNSCSCIPQPTTTSVPTTTIGPATTTTTTTTGTTTTGTTTTGTTTTGTTTTGTTTTGTTTTGTTTTGTTTTGTTTTGTTTTGTTTTGTTTTGTTTTGTTTTGTTTTGTTTTVAPTTTGTPTTTTSGGGGGGEGTTTTTTTTTTYPSGTYENGFDPPAMLGEDCGGLAGFTPVNGAGNEGLCCPTGWEYNPLCGCVPPNCSCIQDSGGDVYGIC